MKYLLSTALADRPTLILAALSFSRVVKSAFNSIEHKTYI